MHAYCWSVMSAIRFSSLTSSSQPPSVAAQDFLTSFDLLAHSCTLLSLADLLTLTTVSRILHAVADSEQVWRPRLQSAVRARHTKPADHTDEQTADDSSEQKTDDDSIDDGSSAVDEPLTVCTCDVRQGVASSASSKAHYLHQFQCVYNSRTHCRRLVQPSPLLLVSRGPRGGMVAMMRRRSAGDSVAVSTGELHCVQSICQHCMQSMTLAVKDFYDVRSEWAGSFTMTPLSIVPVPRSVGDGVDSETAVPVDVRYWHVGGYEDVDHRRFILEWRDGSSQHTEQEQLAQSTHNQPSTDNNTQSQSHDSDVNTPLPSPPQTELCDGAHSGTHSVRHAVSTTVHPSATFDDRSSTSEEAVQCSSSTAADGHWHVLCMAPFCSGKWSFHSAANVVVTDALRYSRLAARTRHQRQGAGARVIGSNPTVVPSRRSRNGQPSG